MSLKTSDSLTFAALAVASGLVGWQVIPTMVDDIFEIQDEISTQVLATLKARLTKADLDLADQYQPVWMPMGK